MAKRNGGWSLDDPTLWEPMSCTVCDKCFRDLHTLRHTGHERCVYGGPFSGYVRED